MSKLTTQDAVERYIAAAKMLYNVVEQGGPNRGQMVELMLKAVGLEPGNPWCAAYANYTGRQAFMHEDDPTKTDWPLPMTGGCAVLGEVAATKHVLHDTAERGDLFLLYFPTMKRFAHVGIILSGPDADGRYRTLEGNTNDGDGSREGYKVSLRRRVIRPEHGSRFVRWADLLS